MRLAFITQDFPPEMGGIQTYSVEIAKRIYQYCDDFIVVAPQKADALQIDKALPFDVYRVETPNTLLGVAAIPHMLAVFKQRNIDITFHAQWQTLLLSIIARKFGVVNKITAAAHARELYYNPFQKIPYVGFKYEQYKRDLLSNTNHFFPVSRFTSQILQDHGISKKKIDVVINGTNPDQFFPIKLKKATSSKTNIILTICRLVDRKGIDTVLKALKTVLIKHPDSKYIVVGDGPNKNRLKQLAKQLQIEDYVEFTGRVPYHKLIKYYNKCDVFVMPSKTEKPNIEGFGIVFLEANACAKPVIGSKTGGIADAVIDGKTGLLVEAEQPNQLARAIHKLFSNPDLARKLGKNGRKRVEEEANWDVSTRKIVKYLKSKI